MTTKSIFLTLIVLGWLAGCEYEKIPGPKLPHKAVKSNILTSVYSETKNIGLKSADWNIADYWQPELANLSVHKIDTAKGVLNTSGTYNGLSSFNLGDSIKITLKSIYDKENIYILIEWKDASLNVSNKNWLWNGPSDILKAEDTVAWTSQKNDDKLVLKFNDSSISGGITDVWYWSAALSDPLGYAIDMKSSDQNILQDNGIPMYARNGMGNTSGPLYEYNGESQTVTKANGTKGILDPSNYLVNKIAFTGNPAIGHTTYINTCAECHGEGNESGYAPKLNEPWFNTMSRTTIKTTILDPELHGDGYSHVESLSDAELDNVFAWIRGQIGVSGYYLQKPTGSISDVFATSNISTSKINPVNANGYKLLLSRKLNTGNDDDIVFTTTSGSKYKISLQLSDKDSLNYVGIENQDIIFKNSWDEK